MEGKINVFGDADVLFAVYKDGSYADTIPNKGENYSFQKAECTNGATAKWDYSEWGVKVTSLNKTKTKCSLYFVKGGTTVEQSGENKMEELLAKETTSSETLGTIVKDDFGNIRYIGASPNNWVTFNNEPWRIIGLMDNIETSTGTKEKLLKIIRKDSLGTYNWDKSDSGVNGGLGVNEWSQADLMYALKKYGGESVSNCGDSICPDWTPLTSEAQKIVEEVVWNTGAPERYDYKSTYGIAMYYLWERSSYTGKRCSGGSHCNDQVARKTTWTGKVGLIYPSDCGYATVGSDGSLFRRISCLYNNLYSWGSNCYENDWLKSDNQWTMIPEPNSSGAHYVIYLTSSVNSYGAYATYAVRPVVYLKSSVKITGGDGSENSPYTLTLS